ncbi:hypothetical protein CORC01_14393, partial [Colletotrichum orchidophilum]
PLCLPYARCRGTNTELGHLSVVCRHRWLSVIRELGEAEGAPFRSNDNRSRHRSIVPFRKQTFRSSRQTGNERHWHACGRALFPEEIHGSASHRIKGKDIAMVA